MGRTHTLPAGAGVSARPRSARPVPPLPAAQSDIEEVPDTITAGLDYPMVVVTPTIRSERSGCLVGFTTQCSIDPVRFMVFVSTQNHTFDLALRAEALAVHLLGRDQRNLAELFGSVTDDVENKFEHCRWHPGPLGTTVLSDCTRWFAGPVLDRRDGGDHTGFLVQPAYGAATAWPGQLGFQMVTDLSPGHPA